MTKASGNQKIPPLWWLASVVSAVLASALTAAVFVAVPRLGFMPIRERSQVVTARVKNRPGDVTVYKLFVCTQLLGRCGIPARILPVPGVGVVPNAFSTLTLCQKYATRYLGSPPDKRGRWHLRPGGYWACFARRRFVWYPASS